MNVQGRLKQRTRLPSYDISTRIVTGTYTAGDGHVAVALGALGIAAAPDFDQDATSLLVPLDAFEVLAVLP
jgi:hypothetical protein